MKRYLYTVICTVILASCNDGIDLAGKNGTVETKFLTENFSGISVQDGFELYLISGNTEKINIESDVNIVNHVKYRIKSGILYFYKEPEVEFPDKVLVKIFVAKDSLDALILSSAKAQIVDTLRTNEIRLVCSDKSNLTGILDCQKIQSTINNSTVKLTGVSDTIPTLQMNIDNGSIVKLFDLNTNNAKVNISGGSYAEVTVYNEFEVAAKEKSILYYKGMAIIRSLISDNDSEIIKEIK
jgi:hypothetical protein